jgi:hypothetical protein
MSAKIENVLDSFFRISMPAVNMASSVPTETGRFHAGNGLSARQWIQEPYATFLFYTPDPRTSTTGHSCYFS